MKNCRGGPGGRQAGYCLPCGRALETVIEGETGLFFDDQTPESLAEAVQRFEREAMSLELGAGSWELGAKTVFVGKVSG